MPFPGAGDDLMQVIVFRLPAQLAFYFFRRGDQTGRITGAPRQLIDWDRMSRHLTRGFDHFADRVAVPAPKIVDQVVAFFNPSSARRCAETRSEI